MQNQTTHPESEQKTRHERDRYVQARLDETERRKNTVKRAIERIDNLLAMSLRSAGVSTEQLLQQPSIAEFDPGSLAIASPKPTAPPRLSVLNRFSPSSRRAHKRSVEEYQAALDLFSELETERLERLSKAEVQFSKSLKMRNEKIVKHNEFVLDTHNAYLDGDAMSIATWIELCLTHDREFDGSAVRVRTAYVPDSKQIIIDRELPELSAIPDHSSYKYVKSSDEIVPSIRPISQRKALYSSAISQITLATLYKCFNCDSQSHIESIVFNGFVDTIDPATGQAAHPCVLSVRVSRESFELLNLHNVDPVKCLKSLHASISQSPDELLPVRPIMDLSMTDSRFVTEQDVLSQLDERPNLLALTPGEFESLITNLFSQMGLETRLTQASRDGGVDCVAFDLRPVVGGKIVIQAKRYADTVGVSAVRDLYGTVLNEGASKGILVTTSGYGKAAFDFAANKPLELISGANLLALLADHAGIDAKIQPIDA